ncbi:MAG: iron ABC transporter permease [Dehalococcoidia bacterium]|nr:iron ABC transporter permease [Dehalococcoidia bacterium]
MAIRLRLQKDRLAEFFSTRRMVLFVIIALVTIGSVIPLIFLLWSSFKPVSVGNLSDWSLTNFTLKNFRDVLAEPSTFLMLKDSFFFAFGSMIVAYIFGGVIAFMVERTNTPYRNVMYGLMFIPLIMPGMLKAIGWVLLTGPRAGALNQAWFALSGSSEPLFNAFSIPMMFFVEGLSLSPLTFFLLGATMRGMDPSLEEAAYVSGANRVTTMLRVTMRLMTPALAGVGLLNFARAIESFDTPLIMGFSSGIRVFATQIYLVLRNISPPEYGHGFVLSLTLIIITVAGILVYQRMMRRSERFATVTGKGYRPRLLDLGPVGRPLATSFMLFFLIVAMILPMLTMAWSSFLPFYQVPWANGFDVSRLTLENYRILTARPDFALAVRNTVLLSGFSAVGSMLLAVVISWVIIRLRPKGTKVLDALVFIPYAIPGIALGFSMMVIFLAFPNPIYGSIWILVIAYTVHFIPVATRFTHAGVAQLKGELEEAAMTSGAGTFTMMRRILVPLMLPTLIGGGLYVFLLSSRIMSMAAILYTPDSMVLAIYIYQIYTEGRLPLVGALAVIMVVSLTTLTIFSRMLAQRRGTQVHG